MSEPRNDCSETVNNTRATIQENWGQRQASWLRGDRQPCRKGVNVNAHDDDSAAYSLHESTPVSTHYDNWQKT